MKCAMELLGVIESSHLVLADSFAERRGNILQLIEKIINPSDNIESVPAELAGLLIDEGVVLGDRESLEGIIEEYFDVVEKEDEALGDEEKNFLDSFLK
jgi:hypothetical protein